MINFSIILADDEQQILFGMKNGIDWESLGFSVVGTAQNGKEALELIEEYQKIIPYKFFGCNFLQRIFIHGFRTGQFRSLHCF